MSILIKMEMPKKCEECPCYYYEYKECNALGWIRVNGNATPPTDCPLIELPPHGDLIDRKVLSMTDFEIATCTLAKGNPYKNGLEYLLNKIENAPTIIGEETCNKSEDDGVNASIEAERGKE